MTVRVSVQQLRERLPDLLDDAVNGGQACVVRRNGKDYAVIVGVNEWRRHAAGRRLDLLGPRYKLSRQKQARVEELLAAQKAGRLDRAQRREFEAMLQEADEIMLRRAAAMGRVL
jgi:prevent-host-death family protein